MASFTASAIFKAVDKLSAPMRRMSKASQSFAKRSEVAFARVERRMRKLKNAVGTLGLAIGGAVLFSAMTSMVGVFANFEQANASLASVMASATEPQLQALQIDAKRLGATTAKTATEVVGLQEAFARLGFETSDIVNMTQATINGSVAMKGELADTAELVGAMVKSFDGFESIHATDIIDQMTLATQKSALNFEKLQTGLPIVAGAANAAGIPFTRLMALMGKLSDAGIDASSSSTALRNIFIESARQGHSYAEILANIQKNQNKLTAANDEFGKRGAVSASILAKQLKGIDQLDKALQGAKNTAQEAADKQLATLNGVLIKLGSAYEGFILSIEDGKGSIGSFLKTSVQVATEILSIASGTEKASDKLTDAQKNIRVLANRAIFLLKVLKWVAIALISIKIAAIAFAVGLNIASVALGISAFMANKSLFALRANKVAMIAYKVVAIGTAVAVKIWAAAQWVLAAAINAGLWPVLAIVAAVGLLISLIASFARNWDLVKASFASGGILKGIITIGKVILDAILMPVQHLLELLGKIPGLDIANAGAAKIESFRNNMFESERALLPQVAKEQLQTTNATAAEENIKREERIEKQQATFTLNNNTGLPGVLDNPQMIPIVLTDTN